jgi:hypothetical protein
VAILPLRERPAFGPSPNTIPSWWAAICAISSPRTPRGERFCAEAAGIYLDYSKNRITNETLSLLLQLDIPRL